MFDTCVCRLHYREASQNIAKQKVNVTSPPSSDHSTSDDVDGRRRLKDYNSQEHTGFGLHTIGFNSLALKMEIYNVINECIQILKYKYLIAFISFYFASFILNSTLLMPHKIEIRIETEKLN